MTFRQDAPLHPEIAAEQAHVDHAYARLDALVRDASSRLRREQRIGSFGDTADAKVNRDAAVASAATRIDQIDIGDLPLCFGRIDTAEGERFHVGRVAVADEDLEPLVVDWRAPVAAAFYRATARAPLGLARRRQFVTQARSVLDIDDEVFADGGAADATGLRGEGALIAALQRSRTGRMGDIVATIQREQDEVIRAPLSGAVVVQGGPGTGKTVVALHRAAYLLYTHRAQLEQRGVLVLGPSRLFLRYIDRVLPSLGERTVTLATIATLVPGIDGEDDGPDLARIKGDVRMAAVLAKAVADRQRGLREPLEIRHGGHVLRVSRKATATIANRARAMDGTHNGRRTAVERLLLRALWRSELAQWEPDDRPEESEWPSFQDNVRSDPAFRAAVERMWPRLTPTQLLADLFGHEALLRSAADELLDPHESALLLRRDAAAWGPADAPLLDEAAALLGPLSKRRPAPRPASEEFDRIQWEAEQIVDDHYGDGGLQGGLRHAVIARLTAGASEAPVGNPVPEDGTGGIRTYGHVVVDEAQDLTPMAWRMVSRRCPSGSLTALGDLGQASKAWAPSGWDEVITLFPRPEAQVLALTVNYRTPRQIMDLAAQVLAEAAPGVEPPTSVREGDAPPRVSRHRPSDLPSAAAEAAAALVAELGDGRVGVVVPSALVDAVEACVGAEGDLLDRTVAVLTVDLAKGLEFDGVVVVEPAALAADDDSGPRGLYVALTRATRLLTIVHAQALPPAMAPALAPAPS